MEEKNQHTGYVPESFGQVSQMHMHTNFCLSDAYYSMYCLHCVSREIKTKNSNTFGLVVFV